MSISASPSQSVTPAPWQLRALGLLLPPCLTFLVLDWSLLTTHVLCNTLTFLLIFPEGTLLATSSIWQRRPVRQYTSHVVTQMTALMLALLGAAAMLLHQHAKRAPHFASVHSWVGVTSLLCVEFGGLFGALAFSEVLQLPQEQLSFMRTMHRLLGRLALLLSSLTILLGMHIFDTHHPRHQGWRTYAIAGAVVAHAVGLQSVLWQTMPITWHFLSTRPLAMTDSTSRLRVEPVAAMRTNSNRL